MGVVDAGVRSVRSVAKERIGDPYRPVMTGDVPLVQVRLRDG